MIQKLMEELNNAVIIGKSLGLNTADSVKELIDSKKLSKEDCIQLAKEISTLKESQLTLHLLYQLSVKAGYELKVDNMQTDNKTKEKNIIDIIFNYNDFNYVKANPEASVFVTSMSGLFVSMKYTREVENIIKKLDTSNVKDMCNMFLNFEATELDLSTFNTKNVTDMDGMFENCKAKRIILNGFDTSNVKHMCRMFASSNISDLDLSMFDTVKVENINNMFEYSRIEKLNLCNFNTSNVLNMTAMFKNSKISKIDISSFKLEKLKNILYLAGMFYEANSEEIVINKDFLNKLVNENKLTYNEVCEQLFFNCGAKITLV